MDINLYELKANIKRKYSFKYKPEYSEFFETDISNNQIIPLVIEVFDKFEWTIVYRDEKSVEAKRKGDFNKLTEKIIVTISSSGKVKVNSKSINANFIDFGNNSIRTGLFVAVFKKLEKEYIDNGKLKELETEYKKEISWSDYEVPLVLPSPNEFGEPKIFFSIFGGLFIAIFIGILIGFLSEKFTYLIGFYELGIGIGIGYLFSIILKKANYSDFKLIQIIIGGLILIVFITNLYTQYQLIIRDNNTYGLDFLSFMELRFKTGLTIIDLNTGSIGLIISWAFQLIFPFIIARSRIAVNIMSYDIEKIPDEVIEYTLYLFETENSENEVKDKLALKGWNKKKDIENVFNAISAIIGFHEISRE